MTMQSDGVGKTTLQEQAANAAAVGTAIWQAVLESLDDSKAEDIISIEIGTKSSLADQMVVASGRSNRHVGAIVDHLQRDLKKAGFGNSKIEGLPHCDWVLLDAGDVIVHVFRPEVRAFYNLEKMWSADHVPEEKS